MTLEQRVEKLERQNRWLKRAGVVGAALIAAVLLSGQGEGRDLQHLEVGSLAVKDKSGKMQARLGSLGLIIYDQDEKVRALLGVNGDGSPRLEPSDMGGEPATISR